LRSPEVSNEVVQERIAERLEGLGIKARLMKGGRCVLASMQVVQEPLETLAGDLPLREVVFSTVGRDRIKCLHPRPLFALPLLRIVDCASASEIEARIRGAWRTHLIELRSASNWLRELGVEASIEADGTSLGFLIEGEDTPVRVQVRERNRVILPSRGPLSNISLQRAEDRVLRIDSSVTTAVDLEFNVSNRMLTLKRLDARLKDEARRRALYASGRESGRGTAVSPKRHRLMLVGTRLARQRPVIDSLRLRNYEVEVATTANDALALYDATSPELVLADANLDRSDGIELIPALRALVGIEEIPVIIVDTNPRSARRLAAQRAGAAGYLTYPIDVSRIAKRLEQMVDQPRRRRFTRYNQNLTVRLSGQDQAFTTTSLGRGGFFIRSEDEFEPESLHECDITLHEVGRTVNVEMQVLYHTETNAGRGAGTCFHQFAGQDEAVLINYLHELHGANAFC